MDFPIPITVKELADQIGAQLVGDDSLSATGINEVHHLRPGDITFVDIEKYLSLIHI